MAALRIGVGRRAIDKLTACGVLPTPLTEEAVANLASRPLLQVVTDELTVLRTDAAQPAPSDDGRDQIGFDLGFDDATVDETSLAWWRSEPDRVLTNVLFTVTVGTVPVAVYEVLLHCDTVATGQRQLRHAYAGTLLARLVRTNSRPQAQVLLPSNAGDTFTTITPLLDPEQHPLLEHAAQIMATRVVVDSGGPIGYLEPR